MNWKKKLFESAVDIFSRASTKAVAHNQGEIDQLQKTVEHKDHVIAELAQENITLKNVSWGV